MQFVITIEKLPSSPAASKCSDAHIRSILVGIQPHTLTADGLAAAGAGRRSWGRRDRRTFYTCREERPNGYISCEAGTTVCVGLLSKQLQPHPLHTYWSYQYAPSTFSNNTCIHSYLRTRKFVLDAELNSCP